MTLPGVENFSYPRTQQANVTTGLATFVFPMVPSGLVWTGAFLPCVAGNPAGGTLVETTWELQRNGQPEVTWTGYTFLQNIQATAGDQLTIVGYNLPQGVNVTLTWQGWSVSSENAPPAIPSLATSSDSLPTVGSSLLMANRFQSVASLADNNVVLLNTGGSIAQLFNIQVTGSIQPGAGVTTNAYVYVNIPATGAILAILSLVATNPQNANMCVSVPLNGRILRSGQSVALQWQGMSGTANAEIGATLQYVIT